MLEQVTMIEKVRELCEQDERVMGALMYGSFALGQGDRFSDIEFYLFFQERVLDEADEEAWVAQTRGPSAGHPRAGLVLVPQPDQLDTDGQ
jgi:predicted nucleotidyltransferase